MPTKPTRAINDNNRVKNSSLVNIQDLTELNSSNSNGHKGSKNFKVTDKLIPNANSLESGEQIIVACRIRPLTDDEILEGATLIGHKIADDNMIVLMDPLEDPDDILRANRSRERQFVFDMVFDAKATQQDVYEKTTKELLPKVLNGYNATVFAYGATGAGKTYTMLGTEQEPGIMFRTLNDLFIEISKTNDDLIYQVSMSYLEIYNELIRDLLNPSSSFLELREDAKGGVQVAGIKEIIAATPQEVMHLLHKGNKERTQEPTKANKTSSRSHAVLQVNIKQSNKVRSHTQEVRLGKLYMIDLAGSERAAQTQNTGKRMVEGAHINRSLLALGNCINALSEKGSSKYVNYRDSKLTRILKDSLGGNSKTVMIAHISPASIHFEESRNTLLYADRAKYIKTKIRRNVIDVSYHISQYQQIIQELAQEIAQLKDQRSDLESRISYLDPKMVNSNSQSFNNNNNGENQLINRQKIEDALKLRESLLQSFKEQIRLRKNILELDNAIMDINIEAERNKKIIDNWESQKNFEDKIPESVKNARSEQKVIEQERDDLETRRRDTTKDLEHLKDKTRKLRDQASKRLTNGEQREILNLLLKNFEFEIKNIEMQAAMFKQNFKLREQDMVILRLEQHQSLCQTLIYQQRRLITENNLMIPHDLDELFRLYSRDVNEGQLIKDLSGIRSTPNSSLETYSNSPKPGTFLTQIKEEHNKPTTNQLFNTQWNSNRDSKNNLSTISSSTIESNNMEIILEDSGSSTIPANKQLTNSKTNVTNNDAKRLTQSIAAIAAQRKANQHHKDLMHEFDNNNNSHNQQQQYFMNHHNRGSPALNNNQQTQPRSYFISNNFRANASDNEKALNEINGNSNQKNKKRVKIKDIVQYKLPDDDFAIENNDYHDSSRNYRRKNSLDSAVIHSDANSKKSYKNIQNSKKNLPLNKLTFNDQMTNTSHGKKQMNSNSLSNINVISSSNGTSTNATNGHSNTSSNNGKSSNGNSSNGSSNGGSSNGKFVIPSIPSTYNKEINMSISGTRIN